MKELGTVLPLKSPPRTKESFLLLLGIPDFLLSSGPAISHLPALLFSWWFGFQEGTHGPLQKKPGDFDLHNTTYTSLGKMPLMAQELKGMYTSALNTPQWLAEDLLFVSFIL